MPIGQHDKRLLPATFDDVMLAIMVDAKYRELCEIHKRVRDTGVVIPLGLHKDVLGCKRVLRRYRCGECNSAALHQNKDGSPSLNKKDGLPYCAVCGGRGDYRRSDSEKISLRLVAEWTVSLKRQLANQPPLAIDWGDS